MAISWEGENSIVDLINYVFPDLKEYNFNSDDATYMETRALITPLNKDVNKLNTQCLDLFPGEENTYYSFYSVSDDFENLYLPELLNSINSRNLPPHKLTLKRGAPIMLL
ncbi:hypothetical protein KSP39_PZI000866 [Platanthera zijinensis]|uniref:DNA helicase Pif1-like 2B domain-containing protein n=1 Tax=Platanthera zijinensis TaxID=2320716 RepID=A0AAP0C4K6_9ASPA